MQSEVNWRQRAEESERLRQGLLEELDATRLALSNELAARDELLLINHRLAEDRQSTGEALDQLDSEVARLESEIAQLSRENQALTAGANRVAASSAAEAGAIRAVEAYRRLPKPVRRVARALSRPLIKGLSR